MNTAVTPHNCEQVLLKMTRALDGDLSTDEMKGFLFELDRCSCCFKTFEVEKSFKTFLVNRIERRCMSENAQQQLREKLQQFIISGNQFE